VLLNQSRSEVGLHQRGCSSQDLARTGLKTIVVMAGGCALQTSPHVDLQQLHHETSSAVPCPS